MGRKRVGKEGVKKNKRKTKKNSVLCRQEKGSWGPAFAGTPSYLAFSRDGWMDGWVGKRQTFRDVVLQTKPPWTRLQHRTTNTYGHILYHILIGPNTDMIRRM
jgi:hypothetical protein